MPPVEDGGLRVGIQQGNMFPRDGQGKKEVPATSSSGMPSPTALAHSRSQAITGKVP